MCDVNGMGVREEWERQAGKGRRRRRRRRQAGRQAESDRRVGQEEGYISRGTVVCEHLNAISESANGISGIFPQATPDGIWISMRRNLPADDMYYY